MSNQISRKEVTNQLVSTGTFPTKVAAAAALESVLSVISTNLIKGTEVSFVGFGSFRLVDRAERKARNVTTGAEIKVPARKAIKFKPSTELKQAVNA